MVGGATTAMLAEAVPPLPPSFEVTGLVLLFSVPAATPMTLTEKLQELLRARVAPARLTDAAPAVAVMTPPPQLPERALGVAIARPAGSTSLKPTALSALPLLLF
jgi:hypothetical protein